jgi:hypothetical protein
MTESATNVRVCKVLCRSILTQVVLSVVPYVENNFRLKKVLKVVPVKMDLLEKNDSVKLLKNRCTLIINYSSAL